jgi:PAS domain-containing protein
MIPLKNSHRFTVPLGFVAPFLYIATVLYADYVCPHGSFTPFFAVIGLLSMAVIMKPGGMIPWAIVYTLIVCSTIVSPRLHLIFSGHPYVEPMLFNYFRAFTYFLIGIFTCQLCLVLNRLKKKEAELTEILERLPWPLLTSDHNGRILYWNDPVSEMFPVLKEANGSANYFDLLAPPEVQGRTIAEYLNRLEQNIHREPLVLQAKSRPLKGYTQVLEREGRKVLLTILAEETFKTSQTMGDSPCAFGTIPATR